MKEQNIIDDLCAFMDASPVNFLAVDTTCRLLRKAGFEELDMRAEWSLRSGDRRYVVKNGSAVFAFIVGDGMPSEGFHIISAHSDSPGFRIKPNCEIACEGGCCEAEYRSVWRPDSLHMVRPSALDCRTCYAP